MHEIRLETRPNREAKTILELTKELKKLIKQLEYERTKTEWLLVKILSAHECVIATQNKLIDKTEVQIKRLRKGKDRASKRQKLTFDQVSIAMSTAQNKKNSIDD